MTQLQGSVSEGLTNMKLRSLTKLENRHQQSSNVPDNRLESIPAAGVSAQSSKPSKKRKRNNASSYANPKKRRASGRTTKSHNSSDLAQAESVEDGFADMPNELWLDIMSNLDYFDLKRCAGVSQRFRALVANHDFDHVLFRNRSIVTDHTSQTVPKPWSLNFQISHEERWSGVHPGLKNFRTCCKYFADYGGPRCWKHGRCIRLPELSTNTASGFSLEEYASVPKATAVAILQFRFSRKPKFLTYNIIESGVTVQDLVVAAASVDEDRYYTFLYDIQFDSVCDISSCRRAVRYRCTHERRPAVILTATYWRPPGTS